MRVLSEIKNRGTQDCLIAVCDGLKGLPEAIATIWSQTIVQTCIVHVLCLGSNGRSDRPLF
jgi:putative transposase